MTAIIFITIIIIILTLHCLTENEALDKKTQTERSSSL